MRPQMVAYSDVSISLDILVHASAYAVLAVVPAANGHIPEAIFFLAG